MLDSNSVAPAKGVRLDVLIQPLLTRRRGSDHESDAAAVTQRDDVRRGDCRLR
jgi:hypothetical protein